MLGIACRRCSRLLRNRPALPAPPAPLSSSRRASSSSSSPSAPTASSTPGTVSNAGPERSRIRSDPPVSRKSRTPPPLTPTQVRDELVDLLQGGQPREALQAFLRAVENPHETANASTVGNFARLFLKYRQPSIAFKALDAVHRKGYAVPPQLAAKLLAALGDELVLDNDALVEVLGWLSDGVLSGSSTDGEADVQVLVSVFETLLKAGRTDWLAEVFRLYRSTLESGKIGSSRLWSLAISAKVLDNDQAGAKALFDTWRVATKDQEGPSSPAPRSIAPYLALLSFYIDRVPPLATSSDPAYTFLRTIRNDGLPPSTPLLNAFLRLELSRNRFSSFWGLWRKLDELNLERSLTTWNAAVQAKFRSEAVRKKRQRGRTHNSPLLSSAPFSYSEQRTPPSRNLFRTLLSDRLRHTNHRPALRLPVTTPDPLTPQLLNSFLDLFMYHRDFQAATVVLETFSVHRIEPDARTHGSVVLGVVKHWEKGKLVGRLEEERQARLAEGMPFGRSEDLKRETRTGGYGALGGPDSLALIKQILERRKVRAGLWTSPPVEDRAEAAELAGAEEAGAEEEDEPALPPFPPSQSEQQSELRNLRYLVDLLRRCEDKNDEQWWSALVETRKEMLPEGKERDEGERGKKNGRRIDDYRRWVHRAYGARLRK